MVRIWLIGFGISLTMGVVGCSENSSGSVGNVQIVASEDGTVEVIVQDKVLFALAATGPVARNFTERPVGVGTVSFERSQEVSERLSVRSVVNEGSGARVEYSNTDGSRTATLTAVALDDEVSEFRLELAGSADSIAVGIRCDEGGTFHGFGEQYNATNQRGEAFQLLVNEQGAGRDGSSGVSVGDEHTTYFPMPYYIDARGFGALFDTKRRVDVDLCASDPAVAWIEVISGAPVQWRVFHGPSALDVIRQLGDLVGRLTQPPAWAYNLWMAGQGGRDSVLSEVAALEAANVPVAAFWVQDWGGIRTNLGGGFGVQYIWEPDETLYPNFAGMVSDFHDAGYKFLTYVNPFIVDPASVSEEDGPARFAPRFDQMDETGLLLAKGGETYIEFAAPNFPQGNAQPDFSNPATLDFISESLADVVRAYDVDGWMADFGEWVPVDSEPQDGSDSIERRNTFPIAWQRATREAMRDVRPDGDWAMFARSGFTGVQSVAQIHWVGDQETDWSELDGLPTVVPAMLNLGLAGQPFVTHDIAGFGNRGVGPSTKELFQRWTELGAFTPIMRTHDGADKVNNWRWNKDEGTTSHFRKFAYVHCALMNDFMTLAAEAEASGAPIVRHLMLVFPDDARTWDISDQFMIGDSLLVAPVTEEGATSRSVYFPAGSWHNVWTGDRVEGGQRSTANAPIGSPPVYSRGEDRDDLRNWEMLSYEDCR